MKPATEAGDVLACELTLAREDKRDGGLASKFSDKIPLREAMMIKEKSQNVFRCGIWYWIVLRFVLID
jgi:hypothetical protein